MTMAALPFGEGGKQDSRHAGARDASKEPFRGREAFDRRQPGPFALVPNL